MSVFGGASYIGRFVEQGFDSGQRELKGKKLSNGVGGVAVGAVAGRNAGQVAVFFLPTTLRWRDDTGTGSDALDEDDVIDIDAYVVSGEFVRYLASAEEHTVVPYTMTGVTATYWKLDDTSGPIRGAGSDGDDDALFKFGVTAGFGAQIQPGGPWSVKIGVVTSKLGNPFSGKDSFQPVDGQTFDEPGTVTAVGGFAGLTYTFWR